MATELANLIKDGSTLHYSLLWTSPESRARFSQRLSLINTLATTLEDVHEPEVAQKKIHWWHEELQRLHDGNARHPATQQNQPNLCAMDQAQAACLAIVSTASTQRFTPAATTEEGDSLVINSFKARLALLSHALSNNSADLDFDSHPDIAASSLGQHEQLARLPQLIHRGLPVFSGEMYRQFGISAHDLAEHIRIASPGPSADANDTTESSHSVPAPLHGIPIVTEKPGRQNLLFQAIERNHDALTNAVGDEAVVERYRRPPLLPIWRLLMLRKYQLALWKKQRPDLLRERVTLTPMTKLFRAWQNRR